MSSPPDFIGIGAQKAATSWLYHILSEHPNVWVTPTKELHFFNLQRNQDSHISRILLKKEGYRKSINRFRYSPKYKFLWLFKFLFRKRDHDYYFSLFTPNNKQIAGEVTPAYARLNVDQIATVHSIMPDVKVIYILRNPIERNWSSVCMSFENSKKESVENQTVETLINQVSKPNRVAHANYIDNLNNWETHFSSDQIFIGFFTEIRDQPVEFCQRLFEFLELPSVDLSIFKNKFLHKSNSFSQAIPPEVLIALAKSEFNNIQNAHQRFNNQYTVEWVKQLDSILS